MTLSESTKTDGESAVSSAPVKPVSSGGVSSKSSEGVLLAPSTPVKSIGDTGGSAGIRIGCRAKAYVSRGGKGKAIASDNVGEVIAFKDAKLGPHDGELQFRLIHFWEAWNTVTKVLIGLEMLLIDREETAIQGFIPADVTISFSWNSVLSELVDKFDAACDMRGELYDYIGHIKLVNGQTPSESLLLDEANIVASRRVDLHVQTHDDPVLKLCLWDQAASEFWKKFRASGGTARVVLVTTLNPKRYGVLSLSSMTPSRVFLDGDIQETRDYLGWLSSNQDVANRLNADVVVKPEPATLGELFSYMKRASAKVAWFECTTTIDNVVHGSKWYYIGCGDCHTKATKGPTTLMCRKCGKNEVVGVAQYLAKLSVYDHKDQAFFVLLGDAGEELTGKKAAELVESYYEANDGTRTFIVKISTHNLDGKTQTLTVTKVLPLEAPAPEVKSGDEVDVELCNEREDLADESVKRAADGVGSEDAKRARCPIFPVHNLSPQSYESLLRLATTPTYLPDVVGQIRMMQNLDPFHPDDSTDLTVGLLLSRSTMVKLKLWDKQAADFSMLQSKKNMKFKVVIFTSMIPKIFEGSLSASSSYNEGNSFVIFFYLFITFSPKSISTVFLFYLSTVFTDSPPPWLIRALLLRIKLGAGVLARKMAHAESTTSSDRNLRSYRLKNASRSVVSSTLIPFQLWGATLAAIALKKRQSGTAISVSEGL
ncbi:hypothetical protein Bca101_060330 [Brassica carinata]